MSKKITLRNVSPLGYLDVPILGRQGPAPSYADCTECGGDPLSEHEHEIDETTKQHDEPGVGCLKPGEEFTTTEEIGARLLEQVGNFELVKTKPVKRAAAKKAASSRAAKKAASASQPDELVDADGGADVHDDTPEA